MNRTFADMVVFKNDGIFRTIIKEETRNNLLIVVKCFIKFCFFLILLNIDVRIIDSLYNKYILKISFKVIEDH